MNVVATTLSRLRIGDVFKMENRLYRVDLLNDCRARCAPITRTNESTEYANISPNSEVEIIGYWKTDTQSVRFYGAEASESLPSHFPSEVPADPAPAEDLGEQQTLL